MEHESSILYEPFNKYIWRHAFGVDVPDHVLMAGLVFVICLIVFPLATRRLSRDNPGPLQQILELLIVGLRDMMHDIIGHGSERFLGTIAAFTVFIFISNIFGLFYFNGVKGQRALIVLSDGADTGSKFQLTDMLEYMAPKVAAFLVDG